MIPQAPAATFSKARRNRTFALGVAAGAALMLALNFAIGATAAKPTPTPQPTVTVTVTADANPQAQATAAQPDQGLGIDMARRLEGDFMALGPVDAPIVIVEYADYRCPFCSLFEQQTLPLLTNEYMDAGLVRFEFRDMPLFGEQSVDSAIAGRAAGRQGLFWPYMTAVAANGVVEGGHPDLTRERLIGFAQTVGVPDIDKFTADLDDPQLLADVQKDLTEGRQIGFSGVPAFLVGDTPVVGAQPVDVFRQVIDQELAQAGVVR